MTIVEGATEEDFIRKILAPYLGIKNIGMYATQVSKPGQKEVMSDSRGSRMISYIILNSGMILLWLCFLIITA